MYRALSSLKEEWDENVLTKTIARYKGWILHAQRLFLWIPVAVRINNGGWLLPSWPACEASHESLPRANL